MGSCIVGSFLSLTFISVRAPRGSALCGFGAANLALVLEVEGGEGEKVGREPVVCDHLLQEHVPACSATEERNKRW
eukprot:288295-Rhodomonas_salina.1